MKHKVHGKKCVPEYQFLSFRAVFMKLMFGGPLSNNLCDSFPQLVADMAHRKLFYFRSQSHKFLYILVITNVPQITKC